MQHSLVIGIIYKTICDNMDSYGYHIILVHTGFVLLDTTVNCHWQDLCGTVGLVYAIFYGTFCLCKSCLIAFLEPTSTKQRG